MEVGTHLDGEPFGFCLVFSANHLPETARGSTVDSFDKERIRDGRSDEVLEFCVRLVKFLILLGSSSEHIGFLGGWIVTKGFRFDGTGDGVIQQMR
jgi:hypothetical protein